MPQPVADGSAVCPECSSPVAGVRALSTFCCAACRQAFNNRRARRGAALYDLFMALRYQRGLAKALGIFSLLCAMAQTYRDEDVQRRGHGWRSWLDPDVTLAHKPWLRAKRENLRP